MRVCLKHVGMQCYGVYTYDCSVGETTSTFRQVAPAGRRRTLGSRRQDEHFRHIFQTPFISLITLPPVLHTGRSLKKVSEVSAPRFWGGRVYYGLIL